MRDFPAAPKLPTGFRLATPENWFDLDLDPRTRNQSIAALVAARIPRSPEIGERREELIRLLRHAAREAAQHKVMFASLMSEVVDGRPMAASVNVTVTSMTTDRGGGLAVTDPQAVFAAFTRMAAQPDTAQRSEVSIVELQVGRAVRVCGLREDQVPGAAQPIQTSMLQYFVPVPASQLMAIVTFNTPNIGMAMLFTELFDVMIGSFDFVWDGNEE